jgi:hypothetical protein
MTASPALTLRKRRWTIERIARLRFLVGIGWNANRIADDPVIATTPNNVHRHAHKFGISFRAATPTICSLPPAATSYFAAAGARRGITRAEMIRRLLLEVASDPNLLDNIIDDGVGSA